MVIFFGSSVFDYDVFGSDYQRTQIRSVTVVDTLADMPEDAWDVSEAGNGTVMTWVKPNGELYDLYIGAEGGVCAGTSCRTESAGFWPVPGTRNPCWMKRSRKNCPEMPSFVWV